MLEVDQVHECKKLNGQGMPIRQIVKETGFARNTVRRYLRGEAVPGVYQLKKSKPRPVIGSVIKVVTELLVAEKEAHTPRKQRLSAARIYRILRLEHGFLGSESSVRKLVRGIRGEQRDPLDKAFVPLDYEPGIDAQVDFFESLVEYEAGVQTKCFVLLVRPCFSGRVFVYVAPNQTQEALFEGLVQSFEFFGGVFQNVWFDNLTPAVRRVLEGRKREMQKDFAAFVAHYGFEAQFCRPARGNEKGGVEGNVKFVRSEVFTPIPQVSMRADLQTEANAFMLREEVRTMRGRDRTIGELWKLEESHLLPLPAAPYAIGKIKVCRVSNCCWITYGRNHYSVPARLAGQSVQVRFGAESVTISIRDEVVAVHGRIYGKDRMSLKIEHYLPLLARKLRAVDRALPMKRWLEDQTPCWQELLRLLQKAHGEVEGSKQFVASVKLCVTHGTHVVTKALERAMQKPAISLVMLRLELDRILDASKPVLQAVEYKGPSIKKASARDYDSMLEVSCG
jgi:transposase